MSILARLPAIITKAKTIAQQGRGVMRAVKGSGTAQAAGRILPGVGMVAGGTALGGAALSALSGGGMTRRRRSRGITARDFRTTRRTMKKIIKMYGKLPKRPSVRGGAPGKGGHTILNVE